MHAQSQNHTAPHSQNHTPAAAHPMPKPQPPQQPQQPQPPKAAGPASPDATEWRSIKNDLDLAKGILDEAATVVPNLVPAGEAREITMAVLFALRDICTSVDQELAKTLMGRTKQNDDIDTLISGALANVKSSNMILNFALPLLGKLAGLLIGKMNVSPYLQAVLVGVLEGVAQLLQEPALQKDLSNLPVLGEIESFLGGGTQHKAA